MDFISVPCATGRRLRVLSVIDTGTRECLALEVDSSLPAARVVRVLDEVTSLRGVPRAITVDNGPEFVARPFDAWTYDRQVQLAFIRPGEGRRERERGKLSRHDPRGKPRQALVHGSARRPRYHLGLA